MQSERTSDGPKLPMLISHARKSSGMSEEVNGSASASSGAGLGISTSGVNSSTNTAINTPSIGTPIQTPAYPPMPANYITFDNLSQAPTIDTTAALPEPLSLAPPAKFLLTKFTIYETKTKMYIVGSNARESRFRMLEIDLTSPKDQLIISEKTPSSVSRSGIIEMLSNVEKDADSTRGKSGFGNNGLTKRLTAWSILGFIRFTEGYYISVVTKRSVVALIGGHFIYHIESTELIPITHSSVYRKPDRRSDEARFMNTFQSLDLSRTFYYSDSYDITHTLQYNMIREKETILGLYDEKPSTDRCGKYNERFLWNIQLLEPVRNSFEGILDWCTAIIHGFIDQAKISVSGRNILVIILARRSRYFAGARFLKRGVNDQGNVANEVETEQIVCDHLTTSFHDPQDGIFNNPRYTSYVQHRGSIPLYWTQDVSKNMTPKPPIELNAVDPFFSSAALHFDNMFRRYGSPLLILNLIKTRERIPREVKLLGEFEQCINYLNQFLPESAKMKYTSWDMSRASKSRDQEVIEFLENYAEKTLQTTGFFHNGKNLNWLKIQDGICRTNCIDCLDRTNAAQFVIGKKALGYQLFALGITNTVNIEYDSDVVNLLTEMYHDHGDTIALQYGGSHLVNTMETYRKINQWTSHSRDMIESIRRFYSNSFVDSQRQDAINLFLGNYVWSEGQPNLWDLSTDYYLHNDFFVRSKPRRSYLKWWTPSNLLSIHNRLQEKITKIDIENEEFEPLVPYREFYDNYWNEYYRPRTLTSMKSTFAYNMNSTLRYLPMSSKLNNHYDMLLTSPFISRKPEEKESATSSTTSSITSNTTSNTSTTSSSRSKKSKHSRTGNIRKEAMKRASMIYQTPTLPKIISNRVFSGRPITSNKTSEETVSSISTNNTNSRKPSETSTITPFNDSHPTLSSFTITQQVEKLLEPTVTPHQHNEYNQYIKNDLQFETDTSNSNLSPKYADFFITPDDILSNLKVSTSDYQIYQHYYKLSHLDNDPKTGSIENPLDFNGQSMYQQWLSLDLL